MRCSLVLSRAGVAQSAGVEKRLSGCGLLAPGRRAATRHWADTVNRIRVVIRATDALTAAGLERSLRRWPGMEILAPERVDPPHVAVLAGHHATVDEVTALRGERVPAGVPIVLVVAHSGDLGALAACHVVTVVPRAAAANGEMAETVAIAAGRAGSDPEDLRTELVRQAEKLRHELSAEPTGSGPAGLADRELAVLRLLGEGLDTADIALQLCYSERTVKNIIYAVTSRLHLRNRVHAVAYAARAGLI
jgi:DNA-binding NarL/FixJ family response regulator